MSTLFVDELIRGALNDPLGNEDAPPWATVVARSQALLVAQGGAQASPTSRGLRSFARRRRRVLIAALVAAVVIVPPAYAFRTQLIHLIVGQPAPKSVTITFEQWNVRSVGADKLDQAFAQATGMPFGFRLPKVETSKAQGVAELQLPQGTVSLWEAPAAKGEECWTFLYDLSGSSPFESPTKCDRQPASTLPIDNIDWYQTGALENLVIVHARVSGASTVELQFADGRTQAMTVVDGNTVAAAPSVPVAVIAKNAQGTVIAKEILRNRPRDLSPAEARIIAQIQAQEAARCRSKTRLCVQQVIYKPHGEGMSSGNEGIP